MKKRPDNLPHPLFHSLVVIGGTAAVACGGMSSGGGGLGTGEPSTGGSGSGIGACPPAQWVCDRATEETLCRTAPLPSTTQCTCDETRPLTAKACGPSELFVCRAGRNSSPNPETDLFDCSCRVVTPDSDGCKTVFDRGYAELGYYYQTVGPDGGFSALLCGCALISLK